MAGAAALTGAGMVTDVLPGGPGLRRVLGLTGPDGEIPEVPPEKVVTDRVRSAARGVDMDLVVVGAAPGRPVCLALHGRGGDARSFLDMGVPRFLTALRRDGAPPFGIVAVDGGSTYWIDDTLRMLRDELPVWLAERALPAPTAAVGISMGAFGSLRYAREADLRAVAVIGPALFQDWADAKARDVFRDEGHWLANEPLRHTGDLGNTALGVWCGTEDPFVGAAREFVRKARPDVAAIGPGAHDGGYFLRVLPDALRFVGTRLSGV
ncbi:alpha/beta hydrolase [Actinophytocola algeriensis]|uniref:Pimeloyl-ACP methyl ester carboxylesterase n=1 Tax=Actinophytocola algeriensis TaxID=1768010 RepID=A0A7W7VH38_9PSEU|nr:esterase [Actinophytocola algeriensis]MBB4910006.1 pimeloyl-ACP methyl ester carboxylesterase [Actinophytocola algeriensis]MBE1475996.1 pimeloyl-ACP methyl ester carboxylesterase [Actinophytocola algeriensis]